MNITTYTDHNGQQLLEVVVDGGCMWDNIRHLR